MQENHINPSPRGRPGYPPMNEWDHRMNGAGDKLPLQPVEKCYSNQWFSIYDRGSYYTMEEDVVNVVVLPIVANEAILMVRPYRPVLADAPLELPAGKGPFEEPPAEIGARELREETGVAIADISRFHPRPPVALSPNRHPNLEYVFQVDITAAEYKNRGDHDNEIYSVELLDFNKVRQLLGEGEIYVAAVGAVLGAFFACLERQTK